MPVQKRARTNSSGSENTCLHVRERGAIDSFISQCTRNACSASIPIQVDESAAKIEAVSYIPEDFRFECWTTTDAPLKFSLSRTICSYGYFGLAPNMWFPADPCRDEDEGVFLRPLTLEHFSVKRSKYFIASNLDSQGILSGPEGQRTRTQQVAYMMICQAKKQRALLLGLWSTAALTTADIEVARKSATRILRLDQDLREWFTSHPVAAARGFGRTFRSPTLFEDMVKTVTNCNIKFKRTIQMNELLCKHFGKGGVAFPDPEDLCNQSEESLKSLARVGYRAKRIISLAKAFHAREVRNEFERCDLHLPHFEALAAAWTVGTGLVREQRHADERSGEAVKSPARFRAFRNQQRAAAARAI
mmetsp:Transcript_41276/g.97909  ORF Transcript_41276/g.97909 Transcript_41276/m.97909 type:complete len:361 (-) Transcript_41276:345-1427(-)